MKRLLCLGLVLAVLLAALAGCAQRANTAADSEQRALSGGVSKPQTGDSSAGDLTADGENTEIPALPDAEHSREYGSASDYVSANDTLAIRVRYPVGDIDALDDAVFDWVDDTADAFRDELADGVQGTFLADYDAYAVNDRVVSVRLSGRLTASHDESPVSVSACFQADRETGEVLTLSALMKEEGESALRRLVAERTGLDAAGEGLLDEWLLLADGLRLYLPGGEILLLTYTELADILTLPGDRPVQETDIDPNKPMVALTFDDGPSVYTTRILDLLETYNVRATFFVVGSRVSSYPDTIRRCAEAGNEIGIHTWSHAKLTELSEEEILAQIVDTYNAVQQYAGFTCAAVRPPTGAYNDTVKAVAAELGLYLANWSVDTLDWQTRDADATYEAIMSDVFDGAIILCHDLYETTAEAMERVIPALIEQGYQLVTVSELLSYSDGGIVPGNLYRYQ